MRTIYVTGIIALVSVAMVLAVMPVSARPTAESFGVEEGASGRSGTYVQVPVKITNVTNGPVQGIRCRVDYNENVLNLTSISNGDLTVNWTALQLGVDRHTITVATAYTGAAILNGSSGSVVLLNFHVIGSQGATSPMSMTLIELSNPDGKVGRTAPARNGTFTVTPSGESTSTSPSSSGGDGGDYVPATPRPTPTATPTPTVIVTPTSTPTITTPGVTLTIAPTPSPTPSPTPTPKPGWKIPGFEAVFTIAGLLAVAYLVMRRKR